ncbi:M15 family metallopeptidase [Cytobacillus gottheilii]|uniref:M15 family metallopeptidase n=1 Tax=Cytobacillus gottheilii TaxID=859144 RepID=UPI002147601E
MLILFTVGLLIYQYSSVPKEDVPLPDGLHPAVALKRDELMSLAAEQGIQIVITADFRSFEEQNQLYEQGRSTEGNIVTNARGGESYHNYGLAIDFALMTIDGQVVWDMEYDGNGNGVPDWDEVVSIAKDLGFAWGGDWRNFKDYPHFQMTFGLSISELQRGKRPPE